jgi:thiamine pyrophosphate-dependent acetolactate synthase large subunit-like protein
MNVCAAHLDILAGYDVKCICGKPAAAINDPQATGTPNKIKFIHVIREESGAFAASARAKLSEGSRIKHQPEWKMEKGSSSSCC